MLHQQNWDERVGNGQGFLFNIQCSVPSKRPHRISQGDHSYVFSIFRGPVGCDLKCILESSPVTSSATAHVIASVAACACTCMCSCVWAHVRVHVKPRVCVYASMPVCAKMQTQKGKGRALGLPTGAARGPQRSLITSSFDGLHQTETGK